MVRINADVAILGSGFAGSLTALLLQQIGLRPVVIDRVRHPRFTIGESSTPIANMILADLTRRYSLAELVPLSKYGTWRSVFPEVRCGLKRGFSYFDHTVGEPFTAREDHANELLVTASVDDDLGDTHWYRADVDELFVLEARRCGIDVLEETTVHELAAENGRWELLGRQDDPIQVTAEFLVDASGPAGVVPRRLGISDMTEVLCTRSRAIYSHFKGVASWRDLLQEQGVRVADHPFHCDHAAQHHMLKNGWLWLLRFPGDVTSAGLVLDELQSPLDDNLPIAQEWRSHLVRFPSLDRCFAEASLADLPGELIRTPRLQRLWSRAAGPNWAALPHTVGFVDPLHSSGIAQTLCAVERLVETLERHWNTPKLADRLRNYEQIVFSEFHLIDKLVAGCFRTLGQFSMLATYSMLYFAAATTYERRRLSGSQPTAFLCADDVGIRQLVETVWNDLDACPAPQHFLERTAKLAEPYNEVGLFAPEIPHMYRYTAPPS